METDEGRQDALVLMKRDKIPPGALLLDTFQKGADKDAPKK